jgi:GxxExxY protein
VKVFPQKEEGNKEEGGCAMKANIEQERLISYVIDAGFRLHKELGPGLLESVYETVLAGRLARAGINVVRQMPVNITVDEIEFSEAYRVDLFLNGWLVVELKALEKLLGVHIRQAHLCEIAQSARRADSEFRKRDFRRRRPPHIQQPLKAHPSLSSLFPSSF